MHLKSSMGAARTVSPASFILIGLAGALGACGGSSPPSSATPDSGQCPAGQRFDGEYCVATNPVAPTSAPSNAAGGSSADAGPPDSSAAGGSPEALGAGGSSPEAQFGAGGAAPNSPAWPSEAAPVDITMAAAAGPVIQYIANTHVPAGARPFGAPFAGQFEEGQVLKQRVQLTVGRCYTVLAAAPAPVSEIRIGFFAVDPKDETRWLEPALLQDTDKGAQAVVGRKDACFRPTSSQTSLWLLVFVEGGQGVAAAQMFEK